MAVYFSSSKLVKNKILDHFALRITNDIFLKLKIVSKSYVWHLPFLEMRLDGFGLYCITSKILIGPSMSFEKKSGQLSNPNCKQSSKTVILKILQIQVTVTSNLTILLLLQRHPLRNNKTRQIISPMLQVSPCFPWINYVHCSSSVES